jgi:hypothetical protein
VSIVRFEKPAVVGHDKHGLLQRIRNVLRVIFATCLGVILVLNPVLVRQTVESVDGYPQLEQMLVKERSGKSPRRFHERIATGVNRQVSIL